jgi:hypothetical protein
MKTEAISSYVASLTRSTGLSSSLSADQNDAPARFLLTRIKYAKMSRTQRDSLSSMVKDLAINGRLDSSSVKNITNHVFILEMTSSYDRAKDGFDPSNEKSVPDEMKDIRSGREQLRVQKDNLDSLSSILK